MITETNPDVAREAVAALGRAMELVHELQADNERLRRLLAEAVQLAEKAIAKASQ